MNWENQCNWFLFNWLIEVKSIGLLLYSPYLQVGQLPERILIWKTSIWALRSLLVRPCAPESQSGLHPETVGTGAVSHHCRALSELKGVSHSRYVTGTLMLLTADSPFLSKLSTFITKGSWKVTLNGYKLKRPLTEGHEVKPKENSTSWLKCSGEKFNRRHCA